MKLLSFLIIVFFLLGCATSGTRIDQTKVSQIQKGITTYDELIEMFGKPDIVEYTPERKPVLTYRYFSYQSKPGGFIPYVGWLTSGVNTEEEVLKIIINKKNRVEDFRFEQFTDDVNTGIILAMAGIDYSHLSEPDYDPDRFRQSREASQRRPESGLPYRCPASGRRRWRSRHRSSGRTARCRSPCR